MECVRQAHIAHAKTRTRKMYQLHPTHKASGNIEITPVLETIRLPDSANQRIRVQTTRARHNAMQVARGGGHAPTPIQICASVCGWQ